MYSARMRVRQSVITGGPREPCKTFTDLALICARYRLAAACECENPLSAFRRTQRDTHVRLGRPPPASRPRRVMGLPATFWCGDGISFALPSNGDFTGDSLKPAREIGDDRKDLLGSVQSVPRQLLGRIPRSA